MNLAHHISNHLDAHNSSANADVARPTNSNQADKMHYTKISRALRPTVILGPTTVGKTDVAFALARQTGAVVFNADKFYTYEGLPNVTGQSDAGSYPDVQSHLYGSAKVGDARWSDCKYRTELRRSIRFTRAQGHSVIVEGCSNAFARTAIEVLEAEASCTEELPVVIGLEWAAGTDLSKDCSQRAAKMMATGMALEYQSALSSGLSESYVVQRCFARTPLLNYLNGSISAARCTIGVAQALENHARRHLSNLKRIPDAFWLQHDRKRPESTIQRILALLDSTPIASATQN